MRRREAPENDADGAVYIITAPASQFARQLDQMSEAILKGMAVDTPDEEGMQDVRIMQAIYEGVRTGQPVRIDRESGEAG